MVMFRNAMLVLCLVCIFALFSILNFGANVCAKVLATQHKVYMPLFEGATTTVIPFETKEACPWYDTMCTINPTEKSGALNALLLQTLGRLEFETGSPMWKHAYFVMHFLLKLSPPGTEHTAWIDYLAHEPFSPPNNATLLALLSVWPLPTITMWSFSNGTYLDLFKSVSLQTIGVGASTNPSWWMKLPQSWHDTLSCLSCGVDSLCYAFECYCMAPIWAFRWLYHWPQMAGIMSVAFLISQVRHLCPKLYRGLCFCTQSLVLVYALPLLLPCVLIFTVCCEWCKPPTLHPADGDASGGGE